MGLYRVKRGPCVIDPINFPMCFACQCFFNKKKSRQSASKYLACTFKILASKKERKHTQSKHGSASMNHYVNVVI